MTSFFPRTIQPTLTNVSKSKSTSTERKDVWRERLSNCGILEGYREGWIGKEGEKLAVKTNGSDRNKREKERERECHGYGNYYYYSHFDCCCGKNIEKEDRGKHLSFTLVMWSL